MCDANDIFRSSGALKVLCYRRSINIGPLRDRDAETSYLTSESAQASVAIKECPVGDSGNKPNRNDFFKLALRFNNHHSLLLSLLLAPPVGWRLAMNPSRRLAPSLLTNPLFEVPAPHGRWSLRLVKHSRRSATRPLGDLAPSLAGLHARVANELHPSLASCWFPSSARFVHRGLQQARLIAASEVLHR